jgi:hypothetical protein
MIPSSCRLPQTAEGSQAPADQIPDRYELKYIIPERQTDALRVSLQPFCVRDPHARQDTDQYPIRSLYLDTPALQLYGMSQQRRARRWKARIRCYNGAASLFLEIKSKDHDMVKKQRAMIPIEGWLERLKAGPPLGASIAERTFTDRLQRHHLLPTLMVRCQREAWVSTIDAYARVTFDRRIECQAWQEWSLDGDERNWVSLDDERSMGGVARGVIVELKCLRAVPRWLSALARNLCLPKTRYSKYCKGIDCSRRHGELLGFLPQT